MPDVCGNLPHLKSCQGCEPMENVMAAARTLVPPQSLPITHARLLDFPEDPANCMRRLYQTHGDIAALEEQGQRLVFVFGPHYNHQVLSDTQAFHARFF